MSTKTESQLVTFDALTEATEPCRRVRLIGDGWYIEVDRHSERTISIRCGGGVVGAGDLVIIPGCANQIFVTNQVEQQKREHEVAHAIYETWKSNDEFNKRRSRKDTTP